MTILHLKVSLNTFCYLTKMLKINSLGKRIKLLNLFGIRILDTPVIRPIVKNFF